MRRIILASHGMLAEGMKDSVTFIVGHSNNIYTYQHIQKKIFHLKQKLNKYLKVLMMEMK